MLNVNFSKKIADLTNGYVLSDDVISSMVIQANSDFDTGPEFRLQPVYSYEVWQKLKSLSCKPKDLDNKDVLDLACGTGFVSYHLLQKSRPKSLTLIDISKNDLANAEKLLNNINGKTKFNFIVSDAIKINIEDNSFDYVIGNSFLHHFYDVPSFLQEIKRVLKPGGVFIVIHEPTIASTALESRNPKNIWLYILKGDKYADVLWFKGDGVLPGGGGDVWMFKKNELEDMFIEAGFKSVSSRNWNLFRPKVVAVFGLHLGPNKQNLNFFENVIFKFSVILDALLSDILPDSFWGSVALIARK
jgi:SAM-dependent methyltransferase